MSEQPRAAVVSPSATPAMTLDEEQAFLAASDETFEEGADFYARFATLVRE